MNYAFWENSRRAHKVYGALLVKVWPFVDGIESRANCCLRKSQHVLVTYARCCFQLNDRWMLRFYNNIIINLCILNTATKISRHHTTWHQVNSKKKKKQPTVSRSFQTRHKLWFRILPFGTSDNMWLFTRSKYYCANASTRYTYLCCPPTKVLEATQTTHPKGIQMCCSACKSEFARCSRSWRHRSVAFNGLNARIKCRSPCLPLVSALCAL